MNPTSVLMSLDKEISGGDLSKAGQHVSDDFKFTGAAPSLSTKTRPSECGRRSAPPCRTSITT